MSTNRGLGGREGLALYAHVAREYLPSERRRAAALTLGALTDDPHTNEATLDALCGRPLGGAGNLGGPREP